MPRKPLMVMTVLGQNAPYYPGREGGRSEQASGVASLRCSPDVEDGKEVGRSKEDARVRQHSSRAESVETRSHPWSKNSANDGLPSPKAEHKLAWVPCIFGFGADTGVEEPIRVETLGVGEVFFVAGHGPMVQRGAGRQLLLRAS